MAKLSERFRRSATQIASLGLMKLVVYGIVLAVVGYADIAFIGIMLHHFPGGIFGILSLIGTVATAASIMTLLFGKALWFRPGPQLVCAWLFTGAEVLVAMANVILSFELTSNKPLDPVMAIWYQFTAATPFVALVGWILILQLDKEQKERHEQMEFEERTAALEREQKREQHLAKLERDQEIFEAKMKLGKTYLDYETAYMERFANSQEMQQALQEGAMKTGMEVFSQLTGLPFVAGLPLLPQAQRQQHVAPTQPAPEHTFTQAEVEIMMNNLRQRLPLPAPTTSPLAMPPLPGQQTSGNGNGHAKPATETS